MTATAIIETVLAGPSIVKHEGAKKRRGREGLGRVLVDMG